MKKGGEQGGNKASTGPRRAGVQPLRLPSIPASLPGRPTGQFFKRRQGYFLTLDLTHKQNVEF